MIESLQNKNTVLMIILGIFLFTYIGFAANMARGEYGMDELESDISEAKKENNELQIMLSEASSLEFVLEESNRLSYDEIDSVSYIKKPSDSPFAAR